VAFLEDHVDMVGVEATWNVFDWGKRKGEVGQRRAQQSQAEQNLARLDKRVGIEIDKVYRKLERDRKVVDAAREALAMSQEDARLSENRLAAGTVTAARHAETVAALKRAEVDRLQAELGYRLTRAELERLKGGLARGR
jgi:outer membrane protein TolC